MSDHPEARDDPQAVEITLRRQRWTLETSHVRQLEDGSFETYLPEGAVPFTLYELGPGFPGFRVMYATRHLK